MGSASPPSDSDDEGGLQDEKIANDNGNVQAVRKPGSKAPGRKRTKSGCLTCRRRRIKCGEEKPTCQNCVKSKRQCEGYNQRVVFKEPYPLNFYRGTPVSAHVPFTEPASVSQPSNSHIPGSLNIAPRPSVLLEVSPVAHELLDLSSDVTPAQEKRVYGWTQPLSTASISDQPHSIQRDDSVSDRLNALYMSESRKKYSFSGHPAHYDFEVQQRITPQSENRPKNLAKQVAWVDPFEWSRKVSQSSNPSDYERYHNQESKFQASNLVHQYTPTISQARRDSSVSGHSPGWVDPDSATLGASWNDANLDSQSKQEYVQSEDVRLGTVPRDVWDSAETNQVPIQNQHQLEAEIDPFDLSDEDDSMEDYNLAMDMEDENKDDHLRNNDLGVVIALQAMSKPDTHLRSFTSFLNHPNMLSTYIPSRKMTPLSDPMTARIFCHFINVTGPCISMFERHPANPLLIFSGSPVSKSQQHIWTYTIPTLALQNTGLLHAVLAIASLHIAKLQNAPITASLKHYAYGLRRVAKSVSLPSRRGQSATLAAAMLLAYYEVWGADHQKWSNHLLGASILLKEINFDGMTKYVKAKQVQQRRSEQDLFQLPEQAFSGSFDPEAQYARINEEIDENLVTILMGKQLQYDMNGNIADSNAHVDTDHSHYTEGDIQMYETQCDLFWWYCKQDAYQSILGGGGLFMEYDRWSQCPPRAPIGRLNATYGTFDHLILLIGRLAAFMNKDIKRKQLAWKLRTVSSEPPGQMPTTESMPLFNGMIPNVGAPEPPQGFEHIRETSPKSEDNNHADLNTWTIHAEQEWQDIRSSFSILEDHFGDEFQALGPEFSPAVETPFGPALQYRTYGIAGIWINYYMGLIACHRAHPSMPPATMVAAGMAANQTAFFANEVGRISAGIAPECSQVAEVSPGIGAGLIESGTGLFLAGIQYQDATQRAWTVNRLSDIARLTGWETALSISVGCETSWVKAAELGLGPPYRKGDVEMTLADIYYRGEKVDETVFDPLPPNGKSKLGNERVIYALGVIGLDQGFETLGLNQP